MYSTVHVSEALVSESATLEATQGIWVSAALKQSYRCLSIAWKIVHAGEASVSEALNLTWGLVRSRDSGLEGS